MTDIVKRLTTRAMAAREENTGTAIGDALHFEEAACEILRLRLLLARHEWQPIATAPRDREILICGGFYDCDDIFHSEQKNEHVTMATYDVSREFTGTPWRGETTGERDNYYWYSPAYWMELPKPKTGEK